MRYFTTRKSRALGGSAVLGCALVIGLVSGCGASGPADDRLGTPVSVVPGGEPSVSAQPVDTSDQALGIVLADAGLTIDQVTGVNVTQDTEDGTLVWDVECYYDGQELDVEVRASDGTIIKREGWRPGASGPNGTEVMSVDQAKQIVAAQVPNVTSIHIELDHDDGRVVYDGDVIASGTRYDFEIDAVTGEVVEWEADDVD